MISEKYGELIKEKRVSLNIKQVDLALGICSADLLSKIELGKRSPAISIYEALTERLGFINEMQIGIIGSKEYTIQRLKFDIENKLKNCEYDKLGESLSELKLVVKEKDSINKQFIKRVEGLIKLYNKEYEASLVVLMEAIKITYEDFDFSYISKYRFTVDEISIIYNIADVIYLLGDETQSIEIYYRLKEYIDKLPKDSEVFRRKYSKVLYNLSNYLGRFNRLEESFHISQLGLAENDGSGRYIIAALPNFILSTACYYEEIGEIEKFHDFIRQAYYIFKATTDIDLSYIEKYAEDRGIDLNKVNYNEIGY